jgi:hypothetical protein
MTGQCWFGAGASVMRVTYAAGKFQIGSFGFVILNGGEAGVRDLTVFDGFDDVDGDTFAVRS